MAEFSKVSLVLVHGKEEKRTGDNRESRLII